MHICEDCVHFDQHPFIRDGIYDSYCMITDKKTTEENSCNAFEKFEYYNY